MPIIIATKEKLSSNKTERVIEASDKYESKQESVKLRGGIQRYKYVQHFGDYHDHRDMESIFVLMLFVKLSLQIWQK